MHGVVNAPCVGGRLASRGSKWPNQLHAHPSSPLLAPPRRDLRAPLCPPPIPPQDCTTNPSLVLKAIQLPAQEHLLQQALSQRRGAAASNDPNRPFAGT